MRLTAGILPKFIMSGHNKWHQIKRQKGVADIKRGQFFTKYARLITLAVREGGGSTDPSNNFKLRLSIEKAREINMPKENIKRAIDRGAGKEVGAADLSQTIYEGYASFGVALIIDAVTDNKQRTASILKHLLELAGGHLGSPGSVSYLFERRGLITVQKGENSYDQVFEKMLEIGATDFEESGDVYEVYTDAGKLHEIKEKLSQLNFKINSSELIFFPKTTILISEKEKAEKILKLMGELEALDDVQKVYANFDMPATFV